MKIKKIFCSIAVLLCLQVAGCSKNTPPGTYDATEVGKINKVVPGVIVSKRPVHIRSKAGEAAAANNTNGAAGTNDAIETSVNRSHGFEYVIKLDNGAIISVVQDEDLKLKIKQHILVIYGTNTRVVADDGSDQF